jgi:hypothetical protein
MKKTKKRTNNKKRKTQKKKGGQIRGFVGSAWGPNPSQWPEQHNGDWYSLNTYKVIPGYNSLSSNMKGGRRKKKKGGSLLPSDFTGLYRGLGYNFQSMWNAFTTNPQPVNPSPTSQPYLEK